MKVTVKRHRYPKREGGTPFRWDKDKIDKTCLKCGKKYRDVGPSKFGLCPQCKKLDCYAETEG